MAWEDKKIEDERLRIQDERSDALWGRNGKQLVKIKKLSEHAIIPTYAHEDDACFDLYSTNELPILLDRQGIVAIPTGLAVQLPPGFYMSFRPRSGLALKNGITILNTPATIDEGYTGELKIILVNLGPETFEIKPGMRIAQGLIEKRTKAVFELVNELGKTERSDKGFGSTGT